MTGNIVRIAQYDKNKGLTQTQAIAFANKNRLILVPNKEFDRRLVLTDTWKSEKEIYPVWTGTLVAYGKPGEKLNRFIQYTDQKTNITYTFEVPSKLIGAKGIALAINHMIDLQGNPLFEHVNKGEKNVLVKINDESKIQVVDNFPRDNGWYLTELNGIPTGNKVSDGSNFDDTTGSNPDARFLLRNDNTTYVGLAARLYDFGGNVRRIVYFGRRPSDRFGVLGMETGSASASEKSMQEQVQVSVEKISMPEQIIVPSSSGMNALVARAKEELLQCNESLVNTREAIAKLDSFLQ
jgi:hypothetical protein